MAIDYQTREWKDDQTGGTPIDAANLNRMEQGIANACAGVDGIKGTGGVSADMIADGSISESKLSEDLRDFVSHAELDDGWKVINVGGAKIAFYQNTSPTFSEGNVYTRFFELPFPEGLFTLQPILSVTKCQNGNSTNLISVNMNVFNISSSATTVAICDPNGGLTQNEVVPFMLIAIGW